MDGFFFLTSMMSLIMVLVVVGVLVVVFVKLAGASGGGKAAVASMADPVPGVFLVTASAMPSRRAVWHMTRITGVISAEGVEPVAAQYQGLIRTSLWPSPGARLPAIVDRVDPRRFAIQWDQAAARGDSALAGAEALAAAMRARQDADGK